MIPHIAGSRLHPLQVLSGDFSLRLWQISLQICDHRKWAMKTTK
jgi:hypothetical protein